MGLLLGATTSRLRAIASSWQIDASAEPRTLVSRLYDEMTDEHAVKFFLDRLDPREQLALRRLTAAPKGWSPVRDLGGSLPFDEEQTRQILASLEDAGIVVVETVRVFGNEILEGPVHFSRSRPSTQVNVARIPPDLLRILQRIEQQMASGDQSEKSLHRLLGELDLPQLQLLSERWHLPDAQHRFKKELMLLLEATIGVAEQVDDATARLGPEAQCVFNAVKAARGSVSLDALNRSLTLDQRLSRKAISSLGYLFLLQDTYVGGERHVFIPLGVGRQTSLPVSADGPNEPVEVPEPVRVLGVDYSFFHDLLVLLNFCQRRRVERTMLERKAPRRVMALLQDEMAIAGKDGQTSARLDYLFHVARSLNLLVTKNNRISVSQDVGAWAARGIVSQAEELYKFWIADDLWRTSRSAFLTGMDAALCHTMRRHVAGFLRNCKQGKWYSFESMVEYVAAELARESKREQSLPTGQATPCVHPGRAEVHVLGARIVHLFRWMSFLSLGKSDAGAVCALQTTPLGAWVFGAERAVAPVYDKATLSVSPDLEVAVLEPDTLAWHHLLKFALTVSVGRASVHQITRRKVQEAIYAGASADDLLRFLSERSGIGVPDSVVESINEWAKSVRIVNLERLTVLEVDTQMVLEELLACPKYSKWLGRRLSPTAVVVKEIPDVMRFVRDMKSDGYLLRIGF